MVFQEAVEAVLPHQVEEEEVAVVPLFKISITSVISPISSHPHKVKFQLTTTSATTSPPTPLPPLLYSFELSHSQEIDIEYSDE
jgi:hypothetical protein